MRALIGAVVVLAFAGFAAAQEKKKDDKKDEKKDDKIDAKKLLGKWAVGDEKSQITVEFADKGKVTLSADLGGRTEKIDGTYKLDGNKLELALSLAGKEQKDTVTITKLTDDEMVGVDTKGKEEKFKKIKPKSGG